LGGRRGTLTKGEVAAAFSGHTSEIAACYDALLARSPQGALPRGTALLEFEIAPDGTVASAALTRGDLTEAAFSRCVVERVRTWTFPRPHGSGPVRVEYPLKLGFKQ